MTEAGHNRQERAGEDGLFLWVLHAHPLFRASEDRKSDVSPDPQLFSSVVERERAAVNISGLRIQNVPAGPFAARLPHAPQNLHAEHWLVFSRSRTFDAFRVRNGRVKE